MKQIIVSVLFFISGLLIVISIVSTVIYFPVSFMFSILLLKNIFLLLIAAIIFFIALMIEKQNFSDQFPQINEVKNHLIFWALSFLYFYFATFFVKENVIDFLKEYLYALLIIIPASYFNIYYLIPKYLLAKKYVKYAIAFLFIYLFSLIFFTIYEYFFPVNLFIVSQYFFLIIVSSSLFINCKFFKREIKLGKVFISFCRHLLIWFLAIFVIVVLPDVLRNEYEYTSLLLKSLFFIIIPTVYINLYYLIPTFLKKNNIRSYLLWLFVMLFIAGDISVLSQKIDKNFVYLAFFISTSFALAVDYIRKTELMLKQSKIELQSAQSELFALKSINLRHTIKNILAAIQIKVRHNDSKADEMIGKLKEILLFTLLVSDKNAKIPLKKDVELINKYIDLQKLRFENDINIHFAYNENEFNEYTVEPLLIINFLENCFEHGGINSMKQCFIKISLNVHENTAFYEIENSKSNNKLIRDNSVNTGIGIKNVKMRLSIAYKEKHELIIFENKDIYNVLLKINLV